MSSRRKFRVIHVHFRNRVVEFEMEKNLNKWEGNNKMFNKFKKSIKQKFKLKSIFAIYDPNDDMFVDDMDDLCGCYIGYENDYDFILSLHIKADSEPEEEEEIEPEAAALAIEQPSTPRLETNGIKSRSSLPSTPTNAPTATIESIESIPPLITNENTDNNGNSNGIKGSDDKYPHSPIPFVDVDNDITNKPPKLVIEDMEPLTNLKTMEDIKPELQVERRKSLRLSVDMNVFNESTDCKFNQVWLEFGAPRIKKCDQLNRLIHGLKYYMNLDIEHNDIDKEDFNRFFDDTYQNMLDDYLHVIMFHGHDTEEIYNSLFDKYNFKEVADINTCQYALRHLSKSDKVYNRDDDPWINFYIETYDSLYFWLFHLFEAGLRSKKKGTETPLAIQFDDDAKEESLCYDGLFAKMMQRLQKTKGITDKFSRYNVCKKYDLQITHDSGEDVQNVIVQSRDYERLTFKDSLMIYVNKCMQEYSNKSAIMQTLYEFVSQEEYDTDAIIQDIDNDHGEGSNIRDSIKNQSCIASIKQYIRDTKLSSSSFNIGLTFYYWPWYKTYDEISTVYDGGYTASELYVEMKHATFKQEILNYGYINMWEYTNLIVLKAKQYQKTMVAKKIIIKYNPHLHYDVEMEKLTQQNLIALVLYTDFVQLSKEFASTFRQIRPNESLQSIKARNQKFWWMSKILRETVQCFGDNGSPTGQQLRGPFYAGLNKMMNVPEFSISLCSPVSTSKRLAVVTKFRGYEGVIMQFNNNGDYENARYLRSFNLSWISKYKEEDERLFFGGDWKIRIETIKVMGTNQNYHKYFNALFLFDCMVSGSALDDQLDLKTPRPTTPASMNRPGSASGSSGDRKFFNGSEEKTAMTPTATATATPKKCGEYRIIEALIEHKLGDKYLRKGEIPKYVIETFQTFCREKKIITLNFFNLDKHFRTFTDLITNAIEVDTPETIPNPYSNKNTLKPRLFTIFDNVSKMIIISSKYDGTDSYSFSLMSLVSSLELKSTFQEIIIKATWDEAEKANGKRSWIYTMWHTSPLESAKKMLRASNCKIDLKKNKNSIDLWEDWLVIDRF